MDTCMEVSQWHDPDPFQELLERFQQLSPRIRQIDDPVAFEPLAGFRSKKNSIGYDSSRRERSLNIVSLNGSRELTVRRSPSAIET